MQPSLKESNFCFVLLTIYMVIFVISLFHASQAVSNKTMRFLIVSLVVMQRFFDPNLSPLIRKLLVLHESLWDEIILLVVCYLLLLAYFLGRL